jgi:hypothetical protein
MIVLTIAALLFLLTDTALSKTLFIIATMPPGGDVEPTIGRPPSHPDQPVRQAA